MPFQQALSTDHSPEHWPKEVKPEAPTRQTEGSLQTAQARGLGSSHSLRDPSANGFCPSGGLMPTLETEETQARSLGQEDLLVEGMTTDSSILA